MSIELNPITQNEEYKSALADASRSQAIYDAVKIITSRFYEMDIELDGALVLSRAARHLLW
jgi:hypothetical protein